MIINPMSDMPWDIYLDYLADQGYDELREIDYNNLISGTPIDDRHLDLSDSALECLENTANYNGCGATNLNDLILIGWYTDENSELNFIGNGSHFEWEADGYTDSNLQLRIGRGNEDEYDTGEAFIGGVLYESLLFRGDGTI